MSGEPVAFDITDCRCTHPDCKDRDTAYRMLGHCTNCGAAPLLGLFTTGHGASDQGRCPACGCYSLRWDKLASPGDVPPLPLQAPA
jgi:hypothetical protein